MPDYKQHISNVANLRTRTEAAQHALYLEQMRVSTPSDTNTASAFQLAKSQLERAIKNMHDEGGGVQALTENWDDGLPILLFPVRIEATFQTLPDGKKQLWVRVYPDDLLVHNHEKLPTAAEVAAGHSYWEKLLEAEKNNATDTAAAETAKKSVWQTFRSPFHPNRAVWIAQKFQPINWDKRATEALVFPDTPHTKTHDWTQAAQTQLLPDRFSVQLYSRGSVVLRQVGELIPDTLALGPNPLHGDAMFQKKDGKIVFHPDLAWLVDFEAAVKVGMGFKINLPPQLERSIEKITVIGLLHSADATQSQLWVEDLLKSQLYATKGFSLLPQGTPTNNHEQGNTDYRPANDPLEKGYFDGPPATFAPADTCDGNRLGKALGIDTNLLPLVPNATQRDVQEASWLNQLLFPATLGFFVENIVNAPMSDAHLGQLRTFFTNYVLGRGVLPALRIGAQPYGILPVSLWNQWAVSLPANASDTAKQFHTQYLEVIQRIAPHWRGLRNQPNFIGKTSQPPEDTLLDVLALHPTSVSYRSRTALALDAMNYFVPIWQNAAFQTAIKARQANIAALLTAWGIQDTTLLDQLVYAADDTAFVVSLKNLVDGRNPLSETESIQAMDGSVSGPNYLDWLYESSSVSTLETPSFGNVPAPSSLLYRLVRHALLLELVGEAIKWLNKKHNTKIEKGWFSKSYLNFQKNEPDLKAWELLHATLAQVGFEATGIDPNTNRSLGDQLLRFANQRPAPASFLQPLRQLRKIPSARLERCLIEHIDLLSYRFDAWVTALAAQRLDQLRQAPATQKGIFVGAYGWLENLRSESPIAAEGVPAALQPTDGKPVFAPRNNGGLVHTPSLDRATAAALLMAGYRQYADKNNAQTFAVNLSSERVRRALFVLEGIRNQQSLERMLGYQFERRLHDAKLDRFIAAFRKAFPLTKRIAPQGSNTPLPFAVPDVVDGLKVARLPTPILAAAVQILVPSPEEREKLAKAKDQIADTLDAIADLMASESVYQMSKGGAERAADVLSTLQDANTIPPELSYIRTPRNAALTFTNRVGVQLATQALDDHPWRQLPTTPRAAVEPSLNHWMAHLLGDPSRYQVRCQLVATTSTNADLKERYVLLSELGLQAIDFVLLATEKTASGTTELESRIASFYRTTMSIGPKEAAIDIRFAEGGAQRALATLLPLAKHIRALVTESRALHAADYVPTTGQTPTKGWEMNDANNRVNQVIDECNLIIKRFENEQPAASALFQQWASSGLDARLFVENSLDETIFPQLAQFRLAMARFGIAGAYPAESHFADPASSSQYLQETAETWRTARQQLAQAQALWTQPSNSNEERIEQLSQVVKTIFGDDMPFVPKFRYQNGAEIEKASQAQAQLLQYASAQQQTQPALLLEEWQQSVAPVRARMGRLEQIRTLSEAAGNIEQTIQPIQLPYREKDSWLAVVFPPLAPSAPPRRSTLSFVACGTPTAFATNQPQAGLLVDSWTESIPQPEEMTGITFHFNRPDNMAPQTLLLAVSPTLKGKWLYNDVEEIVNETLEMAKWRAVEPNQIAQHAVLGKLLPTIIGTFDVQRNNPSLDFAAANTKFFQNLAANTNFPIFKLP